MAAFFLSKDDIYSLVLVEELVLLDTTMHGDANAYSFLRNIYFFHSMPEQSLKKIRDLCIEKTFEPDSILFFEDMPGDSFFIILEGELEIWKRFGQTDELLINTIRAGQPLGEMALIDDRPRSATVRSATRVRAYVINAKDFNELLLTDAAICLSLLKAVTMMVRKSNESHIQDLDRQNRELQAAYKELKALQDELVSRERLSVIGKFSSLILHDIRNPLSALKSRVGLIQEGFRKKEDLDNALSRIRSDISRMESLAAEFLEYARGEIRLEMSISNLDSLFERLKDALSLKIERYGVSFIVLNQVHEPVILDEGRILRVLINACENACKAMAEGGTLTVSARIEGGQLVLETADTGMGMSREFLSHIFEPFHSKSASGTGLGMVIIKSIIDAHKGTVEIDSEEGKGTLLTIRLPVLP